MLFTWDTNNLCIVFKSWRVTSTMSLIWSLVGVMLLTAGYELVREMSRRYEAKVQREIDDMPSMSLVFFFLLFPLHPPSSIHPLLFAFCLFLACFWNSNSALRDILDIDAKTACLVPRRSRRKLIARIRTQRCRRVCKVENNQGCPICHPGVLFFLHHVSGSCFLPLCSL